MPVHDSEGALDAVRAAARQIALELRRLGGAMRLRRSAKMREQGMPSPSSHAEPGAHADGHAAAFFAERGYSLEEDPAASSLKAPLAAVNAAGAVSYLQSRCRSDVAVAQALRGGLAWYQPGDQER